MSTLSPMTPAGFKRFMKYVMPEPTTGCWLWIGTLRLDGYGVFALVGGRKTKLGRVHRLAHEHWIGPIPEGYEVDHVKARGCCSTTCCNPDHLEAVTPRENNMRSGSCCARNGRKTHCPKGHPLEAGNIDHKRKGGSGGRQCSECRRERNRQRRQNARQAA